MNVLGYVAIIVVIGIILGYFLFIAPKSSGQAKTTIPATTVVNVAHTVPNSSKTNSSFVNISALRVKWVQTKGYVTGIGYETCPSIANYVYCIGGEFSTNNYTSNAYYSSMSDNGIGGWIETIPNQIIPTNCIPYKNEIFCVTGKLISNPKTAINTSYYAYANATGLSSWNETNSYPINATTNGCATVGIVIYCIGGQKGASLISKSYYAPISNTGIGGWNQTTPLPVSSNPQCYIFSTTIYCLGTYINSNNVLANYDYYAQTSSTGLSSWKATKPAPNPPGTYQCSLYNNFIYCVGGQYNMSNESAVYYTGLSQGGVNGWHAAVPYPILIDTGSISCTTYDNDTFCMGGQQGGSSSGLQYILNNTYYTKSFI